MKPFKYLNSNLQSTGDALRVVRAQKHNGVMRKQVYWFRYQSFPSFQPQLQGDTPVPKSRTPVQCLIIANHSSSFSRTSDIKRQRWISSSFVNFLSYFLVSAHIYKSYGTLGFFISKPTCSKIVLFLKI